MAFRLLEAFVELSVRGERVVDRTLRRIESRVSRAGDRLDVVVNADVSEATARLERLRELRASVTDNVARIRVDADIRAAEADLRRVSGLADATSAEDVRIRVDADISAAEADLERMRRISRTVLGDARIRVDADISAAEASLERMRRLRESVAEGDVRIRVDADISRAQAELQRLERMKEFLGEGEASIRVDADISAAQARLAALEALRERIDGSDVDVRADVDTGAAVGKLAAFGAALAAMDAGLSAGGLRVVAFGGALTVLGALVTPLLGALTTLGSLGAAAGAGLGLIAGPVAALGGKFAEYKKGLDAAESGQGAVASSAKTLEGANRSLDQAVARRGQVEQDVTQQTNDAWQSYERQQEKTGQTVRQVAQANSDAWDEYIATRQETGRVEDQVSQANEDAAGGLQDARVELAGSTGKLVATQREYNDILEDEPANQQYAALDLADAYDRASDAQDDHNDAIKEFGPNSEQATDAARVLERAELDLGRQQEETSEIHELGSQELRDSYGNLVGAQTDRLNAAKGVTAAELNADRVAAQGADQIAAARKAETAAFESYRRTQAEGEQQIREARRAEADQYTAWQRTKAQGDRQLQEAEDAVTQAALAAAEAAEAVGASQAAAAEDAVVLTAAEQALYDRFQRFKADAGTFFQPAMDAASRLGVKILDLATLALPRLGQASTQTYGALSRAFDGFRSIITAPMQVQSMETILGITPEVVFNLTSAVGSLAAGLINMFAVAAPYAADLSGWIAAIFAGFLSWTQSAAGTQQITGWIQSSIPVFQSLWAMVKNVASALVSFGTNNASSIAQAISIISLTLGTAIRWFGAFVGAIGPFGVVAAALAPVFLGIMFVVGQVASGVAGLVGIVGAVAAAFGGWAVIGGFLSTWLAPAILVIGALVAAGVLLYRNWDAVKAGAQRLVAYLAPAFAQARAAVVPVLSAIASAVRTGLVAAFNFLRAQGTALVNWLRTAWPPVRAAVVPILQAIAGGIRTALGTALRFLLGQGRQFVAWWRSQWPQVKAVGLSVVRGLAAVLRTVLGAAFRFAISQARVVVSWFRQNWPLIRQTALVVFNGVKAVVTGALRAVLAVVRTVVSGMVAFWRTNGTQLVAIARSIWSIIRTVVSTAIKAVLGIVKATLQLLSGDWRGAFNTLLGVGRTILSAIVSVAKNLLSILSNTFRVVLDTVVGIARAGFTAVRDWAVSKLTEAKDWALRKLTELKDGAVRIYDGLRQGTMAAFDAVRDSVVSRLEDAKARASGILDSLKGVFGSAVDWVKQTAQAGFGAVRDFMVNPVVEAESKLKGVWNGILDGVAKVLDAVQLKDLAGKVRAAKWATGGVTDDGRTPRKPQMMAKGGVLARSEPQGTTGGLADGTTPRSVYGEAGSPEAYIVKDRPTHEQLPYIVEAAGWHGLTVGSGAKTPHAHFPDKMTKGAKGKRILQRQVFGMAEGGLFMGVPNGFIKYDYQQYIPGYPYSADERHKGVDVWGSSSGQTGFNVVNDGYSAMVQDFPDWSIGLGVAHDANAKGGGVRGLVAGHLNPAVGRGEIGPNTNLGPVEYFVDNYHVHWQAYDGSVLGSNYTHASPPLMDPKRALQDVAGGIGVPSQGSAGGGGIMDSLWNRLGEPIWDRLVQKPVDAFSQGMEGGFVLTEAVGGAVKMVVDGLKTWIMEKVGASGSGPSDPGGPEELESWAIRGLTLGNAWGKPTESMIAATVEQAMIESGGDPNAVNNWDSNAAQGTPSKGLVQAIEPTWESIRTMYGQDLGPFSSNWNDPVKSVAAGSRSMKSQWGEWVWPTSGGYDEGGMIRRDHKAEVHAGELYFPLDNANVHRTAQAALGTAELRVELAGLRGEVRRLTGRVDHQTGRLDHQTAVLPQEVARGAKDAYDGALANGDARSMRAVRAAQKHIDGSVRAGGEVRR